MAIPWKLLGVAGVAGVAATGVVVARKRRDHHDYDPDELRDRLHERLADAAPGDSAEAGGGDSSAPAGDSAEAAGSGFSAPAGDSAEAVGEAGDGDSAEPAAGEAVEGS